MIGHPESRSRKLIFSFDYELFLGKDSGSVQRSLINPTASMLKLLKKNGFKGMFFVDTLYLNRLLEAASRYPAARKDFAVISDQLRTMAREGHEIFIHLHPHWFDAVYQPENNKWDLSNFDHYRFSSLTEQKRAEAFRISREILSDILGDIPLPMDTYRAGGWSIQPFTDFKPYFKQYGIRYECSVIPGKWCESSGQSFDFSQAPEKGVYRFEQQVTEETPGGSFTQLAISIMEIPRWVNYLDNKFNVLFFLLKWRYAWPMGDGKTIQLTDIKQGDIHDRGRKRIFASFENASFFYYFLFLRAVKKRPYMHFISHPKILSPMNLFFTGLFLKRLSKKFSVDNDFRNFLHDDSRARSFTRQEEQLPA